MINYIEGPICSGKTTKLLEQVKAYLTLFPKGVVVISPSLSKELENMREGDEDRVVFTTHYKHDFGLKTSRAVFFIDENV